MYRLIMLLLGLLHCASCTSADHQSVSTSENSATRFVDGLGEFRLDEGEMWEGNFELNGQPVKVFLHAYQTDFDTLAEYAKRVLAKKPLPDEQMLADVKRGMESMAWKFKKYGFDASKIELRNFCVERLVIGKDFDGPEIELGINLTYPGDTNQWHLAYQREGDRGSLLWIPMTQ